MFVRTPHMSSIRHSSDQQQLRLVSASTAPSGLRRPRAYAALECRRAGGLGLLLAPIPALHCDVNDVQYIDVDGQDKAL